MTAVNFVDASALEMLRRLAVTLRKRDVALHFADAKGPLRDQLEHARLAEWLSGRVFETTDDAVSRLTDNAGRWVWRSEAP